MFHTCRRCGRAIVVDEDGRWVDPEAAGDDVVWREVCQDNSETFTAEHEPAVIYRVPVSFYVEAADARAAERIVRREINSTPVQHLIGHLVGEVDVHEGEAEEWDLNG